MKQFWIKKGLMIATFVIAATLLFSWLVMSLWNAVLPNIMAVKAISFWQALGLLALSKILFGGFGGGWRGGNARWKQKMKDKLENMTPEQREQLKTEWKNRCGTRWSTKPTTESYQPNSDK